MVLCVLAFCEVVLFAVIVEYQENENNNKDCLLEMLDPALHYFNLFEECGVCLSH